MTESSEAWEANTFGVPVSEFFYEKTKKQGKNPADMMSHSGLEPETPGLKVQCSTN